MRRAIRSDHPDDHRKENRLPQGLTSSVRDGADRPAERAILAAVLLPWSRVDMSDPLAELAALAIASAAGYDEEARARRREVLSITEALDRVQREETS